MMGSNSSLSVAPNLYSNWPYDPLTGLAPITHLASVPFVLITRPGLGVKSMADLVRMAKQKPGSLTMASAGSGTSNQLVGEFFQSVTGTSFLHVPYKGAGPALLDVVAGRVDLLFDQVSSSSSHIEQGRVDALAVSSATRWKSMANVPTFVESGLQGFVITNFTGLVAPQGTPVDVLEKLNQVANAALQDEAVKKSFATMGVEGVGSSPQQFSAMIKDDLQRWATLIKEKNIKLD
jgi:tripartite-type tricarboxylate transporter receptor subunit TctC